MCRIDSIHSRIPVIPEFLPEKNDTCEASLEPSDLQFEASSGEISLLGQCLLPLAYFKKGLHLSNFC